MKKLSVGLALFAVAMAQTVAVAAAPAAALERAASPVSDSEKLAGGAGIWAVLVALAAGLATIIVIESNEDELPDSP